VLYSTSPSPDQTLHMLSSRFAFTCMIHGSPTLWLSSAFFAISVGLFSSVSCCDPSRAPTLWYILMPTGQAVRIHASPPQAMRYFLVTISSPDPPSVRLLYQDPVLKLSIAQWLTRSSKRHGCANSSRSFVLLFTVPHWYIVTISAQSTCPPTRFSINARSILRLTSTSSVSVLLLVISASCMFQHHHSTSTSSPKNCFLHCLRSSCPV
jgi:hypothetical protein